MRNLNNLNTGILPIGKVQPLQDVTGSLAPAKSAIASLVEAFNERDVETRDFIAESKIDIGISPRMSWAEYQRSSIKWPGGSVGGAVRLVDICA